MAKKEFRKDLMHKTRRELVDYVFRGEDPSKSFGYEKSNPNVKREVGKNGKMKHINTNKKRDMF